MNSREAAGIQALQGVALSQLAKLTPGCESPQDIQLALLSFLVLQEINPPAPRASGFTLRQLETLLERYTHAVQESEWFVANGVDAGQAVITVAEPAGIPAVLPGVASTYTNAKVTFITGACSGMRTAIQSLSYAEGAMTLTLADALLRPAEAGDRLIVERAVPTAAAQSFNLAEVGGVAQSGIDWTPYIELLAGLQPLASTTAPRGVTVNTGAAQRIDSGLANRRAVAITNTDATNTAFLGFGKATDSSNPVTTSATPATCGLYLGPNGGSYTQPDGPDISIWAAVPASLVLAVVEKA